MRVEIVYERDDIMNYNDPDADADVWCHGDIVKLTSPRDSDGDYIAELVSCVTGTHKRAPGDVRYVNHHYLTPGKVLAPVPTFNTVEEAEAWLASLT